jgi:hypothetical protein
MPYFSLRGLILIAIAAILIIRTVGKFGAKRSAKLPVASGTPSPGSAFCIHCGAALATGGLFCGGCGAQRG